MDATASAAHRLWQEYALQAEFNHFSINKTFIVPNLSAAGIQYVESLAQRHGLSTDGATHMLVAVNNGNGSMAQFNHPDFGGCGQWMRGGMTMVSDLFNNQLKYRVDNVCSDIADELARNQMTPFSGSFQSQSQNGGQNQNGGSVQTQAAGAIGSSNDLFAPDPTANWWPQELGSPSAIGSQNSVRYAYFPMGRRLAVTTGGEAWVYDTMDHQIGGFSQQQGTGGSITFTSQFGTVNLSSLPVVSRGGVPQTPVPASPTSNAPASNNSPAPSPVPNPQNEASVDAGGSAIQEDIIETLDRLGGLMEKGYVTAEEFESKKSDLLSRL